MRRALPVRGARLMHAFCACALLSLAVLRCEPAQETAGRAAGYSVRAWDTEHGLPQNSVLSMVQTRDGYLWLGTLAGLVRFDGIRFTVFDASNTPGLSSSRIVFLFEDSRGDLWIGTETAGSVVLRDGKIIAPPELSTAGAERRLVAACEDAEGTVWLYNVNGDLWRYANHQFTLHALLPHEASRLRTIIKEPSGPVWAGTDRRQCAIGDAAAASSLELPCNDIPASALDLLVAGRTAGYWRISEGQIQRATNQLAVSVARLALPANITVTGGCEDAEGGLWIGTGGVGLVHVTPDGIVTTLSAKDGLSHDYIAALVMDREGTLWVGTDGGGLNRIRGKIFEVVEPTRGWVAQSLAEDRQGIWMAFNGESVVHWNGSALQRFEQGVLLRYAMAILADRAGRVWLGTAVPGAPVPTVRVLRHDRFELVASAGIPGAAVQAIHQDRAGRMWFGTPRGLVRWTDSERRVFTTADGLSSDVITAIADDAAGNLWIGTRGGGLNRWRDGEWTVLRSADGFPGDDVASLLVDSQDVLWASTPGNGLARLKDGRITRYTKRDGLISNTLGYIVDDSVGNLWIGSTTGLMRAPRKALDEFAAGQVTFVPCRAYGRGDGLPSGECSAGSQPGGFRASDGRLWLPTINGVASVDPRQIRFNSNPPPVMIESVSIESEPPQMGLSAVNPRTVALSPRQQRIEIQYTSLNLATAERARFRYRLEGHEEAWVEAGDSRVARYSRIPPGDYTFRVTACNEDGVWNEMGRTLAIVVHPPFWRTWWFIGLAVAAAVALVAGTVHYLSTQRLQRQVALLRQQEALERERARIARDIHDQLGASLTQVALLGEMVESDKHSPEEVQAHAEQICQTARETTRALDEIVWTVNPSNDTLEGLINYVCKYAQDYLAVAEVRYRLDVPAQLPAAAISPEVRHNVFLAAKEAVTNIVRHAKASAAWIRLRLHPSSFTLEIEDNGRGPGGMDPKAAAARSGLKNMRKRMEEVGGAFEMRAGPEGGMLVALTAPMDRSDAAAAAPAASGAGAG